MAYQVTLIPGDGIGPEVSDATRRVLEATGIGFEWDVQEAGVGALEKSWRGAAGVRPRFDPHEQRRAEGSTDDPSRDRLPQRQRRDCGSARALRQPAPGTYVHRRPRGLRRTSTSSSCARTWKTCTPASSSTPAQPTRPR